jgi:hypothetical protein
MTTLYDTLGVSEHANADELKRAYRKATMKWHPDRNAGNEAAAHAAFQEVRAAYAILSDPAQRREYDTIFAAEMRRWARQQEAEKRDRGVGGRMQPDVPKEAPREAPNPTTHNAEGERARHTQDAERERAELERVERERAEREHTEREAEARMRAESRYADMVALAMRYAGDGYNRDVVFGVLLGKQCDVLEAQRIADSVSAWHRTQQEAPVPAPQEGTTEASEHAAPTASQASPQSPSETPEAATATSASTSASIKRPTRRATRKTRDDATETQGRDRADDTIHADDAPATPAHAFSALWYHFLNGLKL